MSIINEDNIRKFIEQYGNKTELARKANLDKTVLYRFLNGERNPGMKFIKGMIVAGMKVKDIFSEGG